MSLPGHGSRARRPGVGAASYLLLAAQILSLAHLLVVRHVTCPEHGDVMHSGQPRETLSARPIVRDGLASRPATADEAPQAESGHDHCLVCSITQERFALSPTVSTGAESNALPIPFASRPGTGPFAPVPVIALSPKNSPPLL